MELIGEVLKLFAWPIVFLLTAVIFFCIFKKPIGAFIGRISKVSRTEISAEPVQQPSEPRKQGARDLQTTFDSPIIAERVDAILKDVVARGPETDEGKVKSLARHLAATQIELEFEMIDKSIFGSQIALLDSLNSRPQGEPPTALRRFYDNAIRDHPDLAAYPLSSYLGYLENHGLVLREGDEYHISQYGVEYLQYIVRKGCTATRSY